MTRYTPLWQQGGTYPAAVDRGLIGTLWPASGSTGGAATTVVNTMNVSVAAGTAAVAMAAAVNLSELCRWDAAEVVTLSAAPPSGSSRIDLVVLQVRDNAIDSGGNNDFVFQAIAGAVATPGPGAVPVVPNNAYPICQLTVPGGAANLNGVTVTDRRVPSLLGRDVLHCAYYRNAAQGVPAASQTLWYDTVISDPAGLYNSVSGYFTAPVAGLYRIYASAGIVGVAGQWGQITINRPPSNVRALGTSHMNSAVWVTCQAQMVEKFNPGEQVIVVTAAGSATSLNTGLANLLQIDYLGTG
jgi:hypothetical protein